MNRLILIGNGFDLAHELKTDYNSFIVWYLKKCFTESHKNGNYDDELLFIERQRDPIIRLGDIHNVSDFVDYFYENGFRGLLNNIIKFKSWGMEFTNPFKVIIKSSFFEYLIIHCSKSNWVDIENRFYGALKDLLTEQGRTKQESINKLNDTIRVIINELENYLSQLNINTSNYDYQNIIKSKIVFEDILYPKLGNNNNDKPGNIHILNFNYTPTVETYLDFKESDQYKIHVNYIHGKIGDPENPLIFGFGDELDKNYQSMELAENNSFFEYIKSFWYFKTSNYHHLIRFIQMDVYQIYILGHSCGLSDRTLLNMLFEHSNCKSIKIYYHGDKQKNNHKLLTQEISRHFKDKVLMRERIVPFDRSTSMPQVQSS